MSSVLTPPPPLTWPKFDIVAALIVERRVDVDEVADRVVAVEVDRAADHVERDRLVDVRRRC